MRWTAALALSLIPLTSLTLACSGGKDDTLGATSTGDASTTAGSTDPGSTTAASATDSTATTGDPTQGSTAAGTEGTATTTTATTTTATTGTSEATTVDPTTGDATTDEPTTTDTDTGGLVDLCVPKLDGFSCEVDEDCAIAGDCCSCVAYNPSMGSPGNCGGNCKQDKCSEWGLDAAACEAGVCVVKGKSCNADKVTCEIAVPECGPGTLPQVIGDCYTGECLALEACDWVPDCALCEGSICAITEGPGCTHRRCIEPIPECDGQPPCACLGQIFCQPPHDNCSEDQGALVCSI